jgi:hypothetical protein
MATATFTIINSTTENFPEGAVNVGANLKIALTNTAHTASWGELADLTQISYTNLSSRALTVSSSSQTSGVYKLILADLVLTANGTVPTFRYIYIYDDASTNDKLIGYLDYGMAVDMKDADTLTLNFDGTDGVLNVTIA